MLSFSFYSCLALFVIVCLFLILLILIQKGRGGGLSGAFGGAGGNTAFGSKTGDVLTWATSIVFAIFLLLAVALNLVANSMDRKFKESVAQNPTLALPTAPMQLPTGPADMPAEMPAATPSVAPASPAAAPAPAAKPAELPAAPSLATPTPEPTTTAPTVVK